jgi:hypothetical protein
MNAADSHLYLVQPTPARIVPFCPVDEQDIHPDLAKHLEGKPDNVRQACLMIVGYISAKEGKDPGRIVPSDLLKPESKGVIHALLKESQEDSFMTGARKLMRSLGEKSLFRHRRYPVYHPAVVEWRNQLQMPKPRATTWATECMYFLTWLHENYMVAYKVHEIPLRTHLFSASQKCRETLRIFAQAPTTPKIMTTSSQKAHDVAGNSPR